jgi:hypothetical protein
MSPAVATLGTSAGLLAGPVALDQSARHAVAPAAGAWIDHRSATGLGAGAELAIYHRSVVSDAYAHRRTGAWLAPLVGLGVSSPDVAASWSLGPGLAVEAGGVDGRHFHEVLPALRLRSAFELRLTGRWVGRLAMGALARGSARWDFDVTTGVGVAW